MTTLYNANTWQDYYATAASSNLIPVVIPTYYFPSPPVDDSPLTWLHKQIQELCDLANAS